MGEINRLEGVQRKSARFVCSQYRRGPGISVAALLQQLQWPSLADRRLIARRTLFYNAHTGKINIPLCNLLDRSDSRTRCAKNNYKYISTKNTVFGQSFFPKTLKDWNKLDNETKECSTTLECLKTVSGTHTANFTANPTTTAVSSYLTVTVRNQPSYCFSFLSLYVWGFLCDF